ncbi:MULTISPECIES: cupin domain-containing protein [unclassified Streptomyces]|uniref:cupin domain-containing protein n=1 Tax=unclassified Streptomyces TaxID=2593676 RepID=UPI0004C0162F|nr:MULTISPECIES: cupin domain-containing protein [unclassified Streptomyces]
MSAEVKKVAVTDVTPNLRRGGDVRVLLSPLTVGATSGFMGTVTLEAGEYVCEHYHPYSEEFVHLVRGIVSLTIDGTTLELHPGDSALVPVGLRHRLVNTGTVQAQAVFHLGPLAPKPELGHVDTEFLPGHEDAAAPQVGGPVGADA